MMKKFICWLFNIKPEIKYKYLEKLVIKEKETLPKGSILIEAEHIKIDDIEMGIE